MGRGSVADEACACYLLGDSPFLIIEVTGDKLRAHNMQNYVEEGEIQVSGNPSILALRVVLLNSFVICSYFSFHSCPCTGASQVACRRAGRGVVGGTRQFKGPEEHGADRGRLTGHETERAVRDKGSSKRDLGLFSWQGAWLWLLRACFGRTDSAEVYGRRKHAGNTCDAALISSRKFCNFKRS